jgi:hypothetical protein
MPGDVKTVAAVAFEVAKPVIHIVPFVRRFV